ANEWYERDTGKKVKSVTDDTTDKLAGKPGEKGYSPRRLLCSSVGDELRIADGDRSKVVGISTKDRSAILPAGRRANAAYWFSTDNGNLMSSTYYFNQMPEWVTRFNERHMADKFFAARWDRLLPDENEYVKRAGNDYVGHRFGPYSQEAMDMTLRIDRQIGSLLDFVDSHVGLQNTLVVFTADHGASPVPEQAALMNLPGRRYQKLDLLKLVEDGLKARYARKDRPANDYMRTFTNRDETERGIDRKSTRLNS